MKARHGLAAALCAMAAMAAPHAADAPAADPETADSTALAQALAAALRQLDLRAPPPAVEMPRLRYHARIARLGDGYRIELARYNLGAAVRREAIAGYGAGQVAAADAFGVGPHVAWRFDLHHDGMGSPATPAPRRIGESRAASNRCGAHACLALYDSAALAAWQPLSPMPPALPPGIAADQSEEEPPAQIALALLAVRDSLPAGDGALELVIDRNLGNDTGSEAILSRGGCLLRRRASASAEGVGADYSVAGANCAVLHPKATTP